jgi:hypothetical protein
LIAGKAEPKETLIDEISAVEEPASLTRDDAVTERELPVMRPEDVEGDFADDDVATSQEILLSKLDDSSIPSPIASENRPPMLIEDEQHFNPEATDVLDDDHPTEFDFPPTNWVDNPFVNKVDSDDDSSDVLPDDDWEPF